MNLVEIYNYGTRVTPKLISKMGLYSFMHDNYCTMSSNKI